MIILRRPIINEKSMNLTKTGFFTFEVDKLATKIQIGKMVKEKFKVDILSVKTINVAGKRKQQRSRKGFYTAASTKKAIVELKKGQKIAIFEQVEEAVEVKTGDSEAKPKEKRSLLSGTKVKIEKQPIAQAQQSVDEKKGNENA